MILVDNRKGRWDYEILEEITAGIALVGWEVKSLREKNAHLKGAWVQIKPGKCALIGAHIAPWKSAEHQESTDPYRERILLLHKKEIEKIGRKVAEKQCTVVPLKIFLERGKIKIQIALAKGKKKYEKKQVLKERTLEKEAKKILR